MPASPPSSPYDFNCGRYVAADLDGAFPESGFTVAFWAKWREPSLFNQDPCCQETASGNLKCKTDLSATSFFGYNNYSTPHEWQSLTCRGGTNVTFSGGSSAVGGGKSLDDGGDYEWHFLAFTLGGTKGTRTGQAFWDGERYDTDDLQFGVGLPSSERLVIGTDHCEGNDANLFCGKIAEFQIWDEVLGSDWISHLMHEAPAPDADALNVYLPLTTDTVHGTNVVEKVGTHCSNARVVEAMG